MARAGAISRAYGWVKVKSLTQDIINCTNVFSALIHFFFSFSFSYSKQPELRCLQVAPPYARTFLHPPSWP